MRRFLVRKKIMKLEALSDRRSQFQTVDRKIYICLLSARTSVANIHLASLTTLEGSCFAVPVPADIASEFVPLEALVRASGAIADVQILAAEHRDGLSALGHANCDLAFLTVLQLYFFWVIRLAQVACAAFQTTGEAALVLCHYACVAFLHQSLLAWTQAEKTAPEYHAKTDEKEHWDQNRDQ